MREWIVTSLDRRITVILLAFAAAVQISVVAGQLLLAAILILWLLPRLCNPRPRRRRPTVLELAILLVFGGEILACLVNGAHGQIVEVFDNHAILLALPALAALAAERPLAYRRAIRVAALTGAIIAVYGIWQHFAGLDLVRSRQLEPRGNVFVITGTFNHHLTYGGSVMLALLATMGLSPLRHRWRALGPLLLVPLLCALVWSYARSAWLGSLAGFMVLLLVGQRSARRLVLAAGGLTVALLLLLAVDSSVRGHVRHTLDLVHDPPPRVRIWQSTVAMLREHPLGIAPGRFDEVFPVYQVPGVYDSTVHAHSDLLRAMTDGGPLTLLGYGMLVPLAAVLAWRRRQSLARLQSGGSEGTIRSAGGAGNDARRDTDTLGARRELLTVAMVASVGFFVAGFLQTYFWDLEDALFWLLLIAPAFAVPAARTDASAIGGDASADHVSPVE